MTIFFWGVIISVLIYLVVGLLAGRRVKDTSDYYVCGRNAPTLLITGTLFASMLSVSGFTGDQGWCYSGNITSLVLLNAICACGYVFGALVFGRYLRRSECTTMPEYFGTRFHDVRNRQVAGGITVISLTAYLLSSITGVGILMEELTGLPGWVCLLITCFTGFTFYSGSEGVVITDTMMFLVFFAATLFSGYCIFHAQGGIGKLLPNLMANPAVPEGLLDYHGRVKGAEAEGVVDSLSYALTMGIVWFITVAVSPEPHGKERTCDIPCRQSCSDFYSRFFAVSESPIDRCAECESGTGGSAACSDLGIAECHAQTGGNTDADRDYGSRTFFRFDIPFGHGIFCGSGFDTSSCRR